MPFKHSREYDLVVFGASGYTGLFTAEVITKTLPTDLKWAIAGRSRNKLEQIATELKRLNPDRIPAAIEVCNLDDHDLAALAKKTFVLITTVGPYYAYGEHAFRACAENGTHYLDVTGEAAFVGRMIRRYEAAAKASGAMMFPQVGIESAPPDLLAWSLARLNRTELQAQTRDVRVSVRLSAAPSGGTVASALTAIENFSKETMSYYAPFALSPVPNPKPTVVKRSLFSRLTGLVTIPRLGLLTTSIAARTDTAIIGRSWGLLSTIPSRKEQFYGPNFSYAEYMKAPNWHRGIAIHVSLTIITMVLVIIPSLCKIVRRFVTPPGQGPDREDAKSDELELEGIASPDLDQVSKQPFCRAFFRGSMYELTGTIASQAAMLLLEGNVGLGGGVYTAACLGQPLINRLEERGLKFESKMVPV